MQAPKKIIVSDLYQEALERQTARMQRIVAQKTQLLAEHPGHPSLKTHRVRRHKNLWICYISATMRLLYWQSADTLYLAALGSHDIVDKVHLRQFNSEHGGGKG